MTISSSLYTAESALAASGIAMEVVGNNIANSNTTGYKSARVEFADALSQTLQGPSPVVGMQIGTGVNTDSITNQYVQGTINRTGNVTDLAISGNGFFVVRNSVTGDQFVTRAGDFHLDASGFLVTAEGLRVQGYSDAALATLGDIQIDNAGAPGGSTAAVAAYNFGSDGKVNVRLTDGTQFVRGQVLLQNCTNPQALMKEGDNLFSNLANAGPLAQPSPPATTLRLKS